MIDPVCGMAVNPEVAEAAWDHEGTTYYFCSVVCFERFKADPRRFLGMAPGDRKM